MNLSARELVLALVTGAVVLFGGTVLLLTPTFDRYKELSKEQAELRVAISDHKRLVGDAEKYIKELEELSKELVNLGNKKVDVHWLSLMDRIATKRGVKIGKRQVGKEVQNGEVFEMPIKCLECEGNLEAWLHFLFDLQSEGAMLDVRFLYVKPKPRGLLRVSFTLYCAYTRNE